MNGIIEISFFLKQVSTTKQYTNTTFNLSDLLENIFSENRTLTAKKKNNSLKICHPEEIAAKKNSSIVTKLKRWTLHNCDVLCRI